MLGSNTLREIRTNVNTGVEYEIALFYKLLPSVEEKRQVLESINARSDAATVLSIFRNTDVSKIMFELTQRQLSLVDVSFETQNDEVGPSDVVMIVGGQDGKTRKIGLSVKFDNSCTLNVTGRKFITDDQIEKLKSYYPAFAKRYCEEMSELYGHAENWHRKKSHTTDEFIDLIRDEVIANWPNIKDKATLLSNLFHSDSPIEFWVYLYTRTSHRLYTNPYSVPLSRVNDVQVGKDSSQYIAFYLDGRRLARMQVKFNNGIIEYKYDHKGRAKRQYADFVKDGIEFIYGAPFGSWNFSVEV